MLSAVKPGIDGICDKIGANDRGIVEMMLRKHSPEDDARVVITLRTEEITK